jgi:hypothetical protein
MIKILICILRWNVKKVFKITYLLFYLSVKIIRIRWTNYPFRHNIIDSTYASDPEFTGKYKKILHILPNFIIEIIFLS